MSWIEYDDALGWVEKIEVADDSDDEAPDASDGWKYAGDLEVPDSTVVRLNSGYFVSEPACEQVVSGRREDLDQARIFAQRFRIHMAMTRPFEDIPRPGVLRQIVTVPLRSVPSARRSRGPGAQGAPPLRRPRTAPYNPCFPQVGGHHGRRHLGKGQAVRQRYGANGRGRAREAALRRRSASSASPNSPV